MQTIISFILILVMMISSLFSSFTPVPADLKPSGELPAEVELSESQKLLLKTVYETETAWLASLQLENGAIPMTATKNGTVSVNPYFADFAALALLDNSEKYAENVKAYMDWHFDHLNTSAADYNGIDGTIYDYTLTLENGQIVKEEITVNDGKNSYDSTDSYAATFLMVLGKYYEKTGDTQYIKDNAADIVRVTEAMFATLNKGLTYAKPDYKVMYLMDNCEVYEGILAAAELLSLFTNENGDYGLTLIKCEYASEWIETNVEKKLWNAEANHYEAGIFEDGSVAFEFSWDSYYPCATAQLFPIIHGLIDTDTVRAQSLYNTFCETYHWEGFDIPDDFYWGSNVYAAALMGDVDSVIAYMVNYTPLMLTHAYPLYNADAAKVSMAAYMLLNA